MMLKLTMSGCWRRQRRRRRRTSPAAGQTIAHARGLIRLTIVAAITNFAPTSAARSKLAGSGVGSTANYTRLGEPS